ncbi:MAG: diadenylate cyclase CdaA [Verrucomicrobiae bacterium]|nr:diadenylate cyclase CdaA [Verrucomicrobiae bacterium]
MWPLISQIWRPTLEIFILAVTIYLATRFVRGTRGWPVVVGFVILLLLLTMTATLLKLEVLRYLVGNASLVIMVGAIIIFQPEIRRLLGELGNLPLFATAHEQRESMEVILDACERLAEVRIGALIAIEQSIQLREAVESGISVDCVATAEMLEAIFFPNNAIHDGGVIIKGDRIAYAACIFPLTRRLGLNKSLGTRHRAALGLSDETDAVIVVVSEETGSISYAYKGELVRGVSIEELRSFLTSVIVRPPRASGLWNWLRFWAVDRPPDATAPAASNPDASVAPQEESK